MKLSAKLILLMAALTMVLVMVPSCSDRGTNVGTKNLLEDGISGTSPINHVFYPELAVQIRNTPGFLKMAVYVPTVALEPIYGGESRPVPLLILLPPQNGDENYFFNHGLAEVADELISNKLMQPMIIACITNDPVFGGYFFAGTSPGAGLYDDMIGDRLVSWLEYAYVSVISSPDKRGIGGVGMGGYGAFRAALLHPGTFTSISANDGPLDFDGADDNSGFEDYFIAALNEQGIVGQTFDALDSSRAWPYTSLFLGGSMAFSPYVENVTATAGGEIIAVDFDDADSTTLVRDLVTNSIRYIVNVDTLALDPLVTDTTFNTTGFYFHTPFNMDGTPYAPVWDSLWVPNNLENLLTDPDQLAGVNMLFTISPEVTFCDYHQQTLSWINTLTGAGYNYPVEVISYSGYEGHPATGDQYLYDMLKQILIFHSESFGD